MEMTPMTETIAIEAFADVVKPEPLTLAEAMRLEQELLRDSKLDPSCVR
jgi:hypothetical protein